jgi:hypothetical protein
VCASRAGGRLPRNVPETFSGGDRTRQLASWAPNIFFIGDNRRHLGTFRRCVWALFHSRIFSEVTKGNIRTPFAEPARIAGACIMSQRAGWRNVGCDAARRAAGLIPAGKPGGDKLRRSLCVHGERRGMSAPLSPLSASGSGPGEGTPFSPLPALRERAVFWPDSNSLPCRYSFRKSIKKKLRT